MIHLLIPIVQKLQEHVRNFELLWKDLLTQDKSGDTNVNPTVDELLAMELKVLNRTKAAWYGNRSVLPALRALKINTNFYAFTGQGLHGLPTDQLLGKEFIEVEQLPVNASESGSLLGSVFG